MRHWPARLAAWLLMLVVFPPPAFLLVRSFQVCVIESAPPALLQIADNPAAPLVVAAVLGYSANHRAGDLLPLEDEVLWPKVSASAWSERVLARLEKFEQKETDPWQRDDLRIAWITVLYASRGNQQPHVDATYRVLGIHPEKVWPRIVAHRRAALGARLYEEFWGEQSSPKKPVRSVTVGAASKATRAA